MKQPEDKFTLELIDKPKRGRPRKPDALTDAQRARMYRARQKAKKSRVLDIGEIVAITLDVLRHEKSKPLSEAEQHQHEWDMFVKRAVKFSDSPHHN